MVVNGITSLTGVDLGKVAEGAPPADPQGRVVLSDGRYNDVRLFTVLY